MEMVLTMKQTAFKTQTQQSKGIRLQSVDIGACSHRVIEQDVWTLVLSGRWIREKSNLVILGPNGIGKTYIADAVANDAVARGYRTLTTSGVRLGQALATGSGTDRLASLIKRCEKAHLLVIDDLVGPWLNEPIIFNAFSQILKTRLGTSSTVITSDLEIPSWHDLCAPDVQSTLARFLSQSNFLVLRNEPCTRNRQPHIQ
jgi:DNA replication protein DnaC